MWKESEKVDVYLCIIDSLCCTPENNIVNPLYPNIKFKLENKSKKKGSPLKKSKKKSHHCLWLWKVFYILFPDFLQISDY